MTENEQQTVEQWKWWTIEDIRSQQDTIRPPKITRLLDLLLKGGQEYPVRIE